MSWMDSALDLRDRVLFGVGERDPSEIWRETRPGGGGSDDLASRYRGDGEHVEATHYPLDEADAKRLRPAAEAKVDAVARGITGGKELDSATRERFAKNNPAFAASVAKERNARNAHTLAVAERLPDAPPTVSEHTYVNDIYDHHYNRNSQPDGVSERQMRLKHAEALRELNRQEVAIKALMDATAASGGQSTPETREAARKVVVQQRGLPLGPPRKPFLASDD